MVVGKGEQFPGKEGEGNGTHEFAIICTYEDGEHSVHYVKGEKKRALEEALDSYRLMPECECVTIAKVCGYVFNEHEACVY